MYIEEENLNNMRFGDKDSINKKLKQLIGVRKEILEFAVSMEEEMRKKDKKYNDDYKKNTDFLIHLLKEERKKVDYELDIVKDIYFIKTDIIKTDLVHEAIICMLVSKAIKA